MSIIENDPLLPSQKQLLKDETKKLKAIAESISLPDDALNELVLELKEREGTQVNNGGFAAQIQYIFRHFGVSVLLMDQGKKAIFDAMKDYAPRAQLVRCADCGDDELKRFAKCEGQKWLCRDCSKKGGSLYHQE